MFDRKSKKPQYDHTERGELAYDIYVCSTNPRYMNIVQRVWNLTSQDGFDTTLLTVENIPRADVENALISYMLKGTGLQPRNFTLKAVPISDDVIKVDAVTLKQYRESIERLVKAQNGLDNIGKTYGWESEPAKWARTLVSNLSNQVDDVYRKLTGTDDKEEDE